MRISPESRSNAAKGECPPDKKPKAPFRSPRACEDPRAERSEGLPPLPPPTGGPLGLYTVSAPAKAAEPSMPCVSAVADRLLVGRTREGLPEVRIDLGLGAGVLCGTEVRLLSTPQGVEAIFVAATESSRRVLETKLVELARSLRERGVAFLSCRASLRGAPARALGPWRGSPW